MRRIPPGRYRGTGALRLYAGDNPLIIVFLMFQDKFLSSVTLGAVKGEKRVRKIRTEMEMKIE